MSQPSERQALISLLEGMLSPTWQRPSDQKIRSMLAQLRPYEQEVVATSGSSCSVHCREDGCVEAISLARTTASTPTDEDDHGRLLPVLDTAAVFLGWRVHKGVWWCPAHTVAKLLACGGCLSPCPECSCEGGPFGEAVAGMIIDASEQE